MSLNIPSAFERALERDESGEAAKLDALRRDVQVAMDQYERGEYSPAEEVFARLHARLARSPHS